MRTTIDAAGRIVVPKAMRDAMKLEAGRVVDIVFVDGRIEIEPAPAEVMLEAGGELPVLRPVTCSERCASRRAPSRPAATQR